MTLEPLPGRDYKSVAEVRAHFDADMDFICADLFHGAHGKRVNKSSLIHMNEGYVSIRYANKRKQTVIKL
jgi:hypothetical protein